MAISPFIPSHTWNCCLYLFSCLLSTWLQVLLLYLLYLTAIIPLQILYVQFLSIICCFFKNYIWAGLHIPTLSYSCLSPSTILGPREIFAQWGAVSQTKVSSLLLIRFWVSKHFQLCSSEGGLGWIWDSKPLSLQLPYSLPPREGEKISFRPRVPAFPYQNLTEFGWKREVCLPNRRDARHCSTNQINSNMSQII